MTDAKWQLLILVWAGAGAAIMTAYFVWYAMPAIYPQDMYLCLVVKNPLLPLPPVGRYGGWEIAEWEILRFLGRSGLLSPSSRVQ